MLWERGLPVYAHSWTVHVASQRLACDCVEYQGFANQSALATRACRAGQIIARAWVVTMPYLSMAVLEMVA